MSNNYRVIGTERRLLERFERKLLKRAWKTEYAEGEQDEEEGNWMVDMEEDLSILQTRQELDHDRLLERIEQVTTLALENEERISRVSYVLGRIIPHVSEVSLSCALVQKLCQPSVEASVMRSKRSRNENGD